MQNTSINETIFDVLYDVIVLGASNDGIEAANILSSADKKVLIISKNFSNAAISQKIPCLTATVTLFTYLHGLLCLSTSVDKNIYCKNLIISTGSKPKKLQIKSNNLYYKLSDFSSTSKIAPIMLIGNGKKLINAANKLANKYKHIYICCNEKLKCNKTTLEKLEKNKNIVVLQFCNIISCKNTKDGNLTEVKLDTYSSIKCNHIIAFTDRVPEIPKALEKYIELDNSGYIKVNKFYETSIIPHIYAIGECASKQTQNEGKKLAKQLIAMIK